MSRLVNSMMELRRTCHEANMPDEAMPKVVLLFRNHRDRDYFEMELRRNVRMLDGIEAQPGGVRIAGVNLTFGTERD